ncbi:MAG: Rossmann-like and DUF2520 domain-containing protein [Candidatus Saccharicenans sp.]
MRNFSILGAGRLGTTLARALCHAGYHLKYISDVIPERARNTRRITGQGRVTDDNCRAAAPAEIIFICVPDDRIPSVVQEISTLNFEGKYVFHTSGTLSSEILKPLARKGARVASFHPAQTFSEPLADPGIFECIYIGLEGEAEAVELGQELAEKLGAQVLFISPAEKPLYHLSLSIASNFLVVLLYEVAELLKTTGLEEKVILEILDPLLERTLLNIKNKGPVSSLTGPLVRGDLETVKKHLSITRLHPGVDRIYRAMAAEALKIARERGLPEGKIKALRRLLERK